MSVGITLKVDASPFTTLKTELKDARKQVSELQKEIDKAKKDGKAVSEDLYRKLNEAERRSGSLQSRLKTDGQALRYDERFNARSAQNNSNLNIGGMLRDRIEGYGTSLLRGQGAQGVLKGMGSYGNGIAKAAMNNGLPGAIEATGIGPAAVYAGAALAAYEGFKFGLSVTGYYSEGLQRDRRDYRSQMSSAQFTDNHDRFLADAKQQSREATGDMLGRLSSVEIPGLGWKPLAAADWVRQRARGIDAYSLADTEITQALKKASVVDSSQFAAVKDTAEFRVLSDRYGSQAFGAIAQNNPFRRIAAKWGLGSNQTAKETVDKVVEMISEYQSRTVEATKRVDQNDFAGARVEFDLAKEALPQTAWRDPVNTWMVLEAGRKLTALYALNQNPLPALRIGQ